jgi:hypothetical protein
MIATTTNKIIPFITINVLKLLTAVILFLASQRLPYSSYQLIRVALPVLFVMIGADALKNKNALSCAFCWACAVLFQPIKPITMSRYSWVTIDQCLCLILGVWIIVDVILFFKPKIFKKIF